MDRAFNILACYSPGLFSILLVGVQNEGSGTILLFSYFFALSSIPHLYCKQIHLCLMAFDK